MACPVCGLSGGDHSRQCIERLVAMNNTVLAKSINRMYYQLSQVVFHNTIDMTEMRRCINAVREDLDELKVLNEATREDKTAIVAT